MLPAAYTSPSPLSATPLRGCENTSATLYWCALAEGCGRPRRLGISWARFAMHSRPSNAPSQEAQQFEPSTSDRIFRIATTDYVSMAMLPNLLADLGRNAPRVRIAITELAGTKPYDALRRGEVDLLLGSFSPPVPSVQFTDLFTDRYVCLMRRDHPLVGRRISLRQFLTLPHMAIRRQHGGQPDSSTECLHRRACSAESRSRCHTSCPHRRRCSRQTPCLPWVRGQLRFCSAILLSRAYPTRCPCPPS